RLENRESVAAELDEVKPTHVLNAAGVTGRPNVDWCEDNKAATVRANVIGTLNLSDLCSLRGVHCTVFATGCIFEYDEEHPLGGGAEKGFTEEDSANFFASWYDRIVNIPNSMTVLHELLPASLVIAEKKLSGIINFCNPGVISHNEMLDLYIKHIDPTYTYTNFTVDEQAKILKAGRSNNELNCQKLVDAVGGECEINEIHAACEKVFIRMKENLTADGTYPDDLFKRK
ncbi:hypothetical protein TeGR_g4949, partial [Tetraparma gracilis]